MPQANTPPQGFIPHEATVSSAPVRNAGSGLKDLLMLLSVVILLASAALGASMFLYEQYLAASAASKIDQLTRAEAAFEPSLIREITRLDDRMRAAGEVLGNHIAPTAFFSMLEQSTIATVAFTSLSFSARDPAKMVIEMNGVAASVNAIALQADVFAKGGMVTSPIFSDIDRRIDGIHFSLSALINPGAVNFAQLANVPQAAVAPQPQMPEPTVFTEPVLPEEGVVPVEGQMP